MKSAIYPFLLIVALLSCDGKGNSDQANDTSAVKKMDTASSNMPTLKPDSMPDNMPVLKDTSGIIRK